MIDLSNQIAVVSGGSRGIGAATAILFARAGADVVITYRTNRKAAENTLNRIKSYGKNGIAMKALVENLNDCRSIVRKTISRFGKVDILVNSAGIWEENAIWKMSENNWNRTIKINLNGTYNMCRSVVPFMQIRKYGKIINVSSTAGQRGEPFHSHYAASKGGIIAFTKSIAVELIKFGIWVNCVAPGWVDTGMVASVFKHQWMKKEIMQTIPRGKIASPDEIAGPILFLASDLAKNVVGEILNVNGGSVLCG